MVQRLLSIPAEMGTGWRIGLLLPWLSLGCGSDAESTGTSAQIARDLPSAADTLALTVSVELVSAAGERSFLAAAQLQSLGLRVDGRDWGAFTPAERVPAAAVVEEAGWSVTSEADPALIVANVTAAQTTDSSPSTAGDWAEVLRQQLTPGGHVAEITSLELVASDGHTLSVAPGMLIAFDVLAGFRSAFVGELTLPVSEASP